MIGLLGIIGATCALLRMFRVWLSLCMSCFGVCAQYCTEIMGCFGAGFQCGAEAFRVSFYYGQEIIYQLCQMIF